MRVAGAGVVAALLVAGAGWAVERSRFGSSDSAALSRVEAELRQRFDASAATLGAAAASAARQREDIRAASRDQAAARRLFSAVDAAVPDADAGRSGITIYDGSAAPLAWAGRVSDLPRARIEGPPTLFVDVGALGPRLVRVQPLADQAAQTPSRLATVVAEYSLGSGVPVGVADRFVLPTSLVPVTLHVDGTSTTSVAGTASGDSQSTSDVASSDTYSFVIRSVSGTPLAHADVSRQAIAAARAEWLQSVRAATLSVFGITLLLCAAAALDYRQRSRDTGRFLMATVGLVAALLAARSVFWYAAAPFVDRTTIAAPVDLLLTALTTAALAWVAIDLLERRRVARPRPPMASTSMSTLAIRVALFAGAGAAGATIIWVYERIVQRVVSHTDVDLLHFSLHPISGVRLGLAFALVLLDASVLWTAAAMVRFPELVLRTPRSRASTLAAATAWLAGAAAVANLAPLPGPRVPPVALWVAIGAAGALAVASSRLASRLRRASQAVRLVAFFMALLVPAIALYPSLFAFATEAKELLIAGEYGPQAVRQRDELKLRLGRTLDQIDMMPALAHFVARSRLTAADPPTTDRAFVVWSSTDLAAYRLTSAVELYGSDGALVSRFALSLPEYTASRYFASSCSWDAFDEVAPFGASMRHVLRASRGICDRGRILGAVVVRAMLDYRTLPFIQSQSPYLESLRPQRQAPVEGVFGRDVEFAAYGWSRAPIYASGTRVWSLPDRVFAQMVESRSAVWDDVERDGQRFRVYFLSDRGGIYALGYPVITWFGHFINLAELVTLAGVLYAALLLGSTVLNVLTSRTPAGGRALLREVRSSFYRKLFLAFWAVAVVPVVILAFATRAYFASQLRAGVMDAAARTVTVAQRLVEDYATLQQRGTGALAVIDDPIMILVGRAIDEDVNLFDRDRLRATSARDLFASKLLSTRTPGEVYKTILLDRAPTYVGDEQVGDFAYRVAAAPVRAGGREGIVTVPLTSRTQDIEPQLDELDRRVLSAALLFSLLGAAIGYWMAERIADPVNRLTRATRRIALGDLDARIAATSTDELRRLVEDFNQMAADLKRQRAELERTQRIEAWADMARQVAHDIKNPLTPIQLSAEHARRVNVDRGRPLSPVLDECVNAILTQVKLLRQIAAEFSSFASSPTPRPEATSLPTLIEGVVESYRTGLEGRISIDVVASPDLPVVHIDRTLFARALTNVIENALHAMPGAGALTIATRRVTTADRDDVVVEITDTGVGMDPDAAARIFEPYFSTKATGTGLGLTIAKRNVELNGGTIQVRSDRGVGTTVTITLPVT